MDPMESRYSPMATHSYPNCTYPHSTCPSTSLTLLHRRTYVIRMYVVNRDIGHLTLLSLIPKSQGKTMGLDTSSFRPKVSSFRSIYPRLTKLTNTSTSQFRGCLFNQKRINSTISNLCLSSPPNVNPHNYRSNTLRFRPPTPPPVAIPSLRYHPRDKRVSERPRY